MFENLGEGLTAGLSRLGYQFVPFLFAVVVHEFGHGFMAYLFGDRTAQASGRLTLNPTPHIDPIGTLLFPIINMVSGMTIMFGWARPVPIDPRNFSKLRPGLFWVAFAGPLANFILSFLSALGFCILLRFVPQEFIFYKELGGMLQVAVFINLGLGIFNLIPLPPLDGGRIVESILPPQLDRQYQMIAPYSFWILLALMFSGALSILSKPIFFMGDLYLSIASFLVGLGG